MDRLDKFKARAQHITSKLHLEKILKTFPVEQQEALLTEITPSLQSQVKDAPQLPFSEPTREPKDDKPSKEKKRK